MGHARLSVLPISRYASQYGPNRLEIFPTVISFSVDLHGKRYNDQMLQAWVNTVVAQNMLPVSSCVVVLNPVGVVNTDADMSKGIGGYHSIADVPYVFVNLVGTNLTIEDKEGFYAMALSHEIAELAVDPRADSVNPEICDGCGPNCQSVWIDYFDASGRYVATTQSFPPPFAYRFFINGIVKPASATLCPAPAAACNYAPP